MPKKYRVAASQTIVHFPEIERELRNTKTAPEQIRAWLWYERLSEIRSAVNASAVLFSRIKLQPLYENNPFTQDGVEGLTDFEREDVENALKRLGDTTGLLAAISQAWDIIGEAYVVGYPVDVYGEPTTAESALNEKWVAVPGDGYKPNGDIVKLQLSKSSSINVKRSDIVIARIWQPHPRYPEDSWSWVMSADSICTDLHVFNTALRAAAFSGYTADLLLVPSEGAPLTPTATDTDVAVTAADQWAESIEEIIGQALESVVEDQTSGRTAIPITLAMQSQYIEAVKKVSVGRTIDTGLSVLVETARQRLKEAADIPVEMLSGLGETNRWNGAQISQDEYNRYLLPKANSVATAITETIIWPILRISGWDEDKIKKIRVGVDGSELIANPDPTGMIPELFDRGIIGWEGARDILQIKSAAPTEEEFETLTNFLLKETKQQTTQAERVVASINTNNLSDALLQIENTTFIRVDEAVEAAWQRIIQKISAVLKNRARKKKGTDLALLASTDQDFLSVLSAEQFAELAGEPDEQQREDFYATAIAGLLLAFRRIILSAHKEMGKLVGPADEAVIEANLSIAENVLRSIMIAFAEATLFDRQKYSDTNLTDLLDRTTPTTIARKSISAAGGSPVDATDLRGGMSPGFTWGAVYSRNIPEIDKWLWVYGPTAREKPYPPHVELAGKIFDSTSDPLLEGSPFSASPYFHPGDHWGCGCQWQLIFKEKQT
jgi:hypothetical protein